MNEKVLDIRNKNIYNVLCMEKRIKTSNVFIYNNMCMSVRLLLFSSPPYTESMRREYQIEKDSETTAFLFYLCSGVRCVYGENGMCAWMLSSCFCDFL